MQMFRSFLACTNIQPVNVEGAHKVSNAATFRAYLGCMVESLVNARDRTRKIRDTQTLGLLGLTCQANDAQPTGIHKAWMQAGNHCDRRWASVM